MIYIEMEANSPLAFSSHHFMSNKIDTLGYIPGSAFRGAVADKLGRELGYDDPKFKDIFMNHGIGFGNFYLLKRGQGFPIPKSAKTCKYKEGFHSHGVTDFLFSTVKYKLTQNTSVLTEVCPICKAPFDTFSGFYTRTGERIESTKRLITRTAIDDRTLTAREGFLYSIEAIEEGQEFYGILDADLAEITASEELTYKDVPILKRGEMLWVGVGKTRGLGNIKITRLEKLEDIFLPKLIPGNLENRFNEFQKKLSLLDIGGFSITLFSDAIIIDKFMRYQSNIDKQYLKEEFNLDHVELICAFNSTSEILGWNAAWGLPKEKELATEKGSTFFFKCDVKQEDLLDTLKQIEIKGIGLRKEEGFGRVYVCDPFHIDYLPQN